MEPVIRTGDHLHVWRGLYSHHGIACGDGTVIHLCGEPLRWRDARVVRSSLQTFARGWPVSVVSYDDLDPDLELVTPPSEVVARACSRVGERGYGLFTNNCEHFATWCKLRDLPRGRSQQVEQLHRQLHALLELCFPLDSR